MWTWLKRRRNVLEVAACIAVVMTLSVCIFSSLSAGRRHQQKDDLVDRRRLEEHDDVRKTLELFSVSRRRLEEHDDVRKTLELFSVSDFTVIGPSTFPKPSEMASLNAKPHLKPTFGEHRPDQDAVMAFAAEYGLNTYLSFILTLRKTGFTGDVVLAVSHLDVKQKGVKEFFQSQPGVVVYVIDLKCFNAEGESVESVKGGMRVCQLHELYQDKDGTLLKDPRPSRTVQTTRYELYWIWSLVYNKHSWILLLDARDGVFQTNPFNDVPREQVQDRPDGILHFFGENSEATRLGKSPKNTKWLTNAYGDTVVSAMKDKPTICSGSTMGEQVALETYLRAMVCESDETGVKLAGADQGFHNYLYYSNKLANAETIRGIVVFDQGRGAINNLGAMRTKPLEEWGNHKLLDFQNEHNVTVLNWDGTPSPVVHQFDRHKVLSKYVYDYLAKQFRKDFMESQAKKK